MEGTHGVRDSAVGPAPLAGPRRSGDSDPARVLCCTAGAEDAAYKVSETLEAIPGMFRKESFHSPLVLTVWYSAMGLAIAVVYYYVCPTGHRHELLPTGEIIDAMLGRHRQMHRLWLHLSIWNCFGVASRALLFYARDGRTGLATIVFHVILFPPVLLVLFLKFEDKATVDLDLQTWLIVSSAVCGVSLVVNLVHRSVCGRDGDENLARVFCSAVFLAIQLLAEALLFRYCRKLLQADAFHGNYVLSSCVSVAVPFIASEIFSWMARIGLHIGHLYEESDDVRFCFKWAMYFFREALTKFMAFTSTHWKQVATTCAAQALVEITVRVVLPIRSNPTFLVWEKYGQGSVKKVTSTLCGCATKTFQDHSPLTACTCNDPRFDSGSSSCESTDAELLSSSSTESLEEEACAARDSVRVNVSLHMFADCLATPLILMAWRTMSPQRHTWSVIAWQLAIAVSFELVTDKICIMVLSRHGINLQEGRSPLTYAFSWACAVPLSCEVVSSILLRSW